MAIVLDASVALRWLADDGSADDKAYAKRILRSIISDNVRSYVPSHWTLELAHVIARSERRGIHSCD